MKTLEQCQAVYKKREQQFFDFLKENSYPCEDVHKGKLPYDIVIDGQKYDVKVLKSSKIDVFNFSTLYGRKEVKSRLTEDLDIPYLIIWKDPRYNCWLPYRVNKLNILHSWCQALHKKDCTRFQISSTNHDGNKHILIDIRDMFNEDNLVGGSDDFKVPLRPLLTKFDPKD